MATSPPANGNGSRWWQVWLPVFAAGFVVIAGVANYFISQGVSATTIAALQSASQSQLDRINKQQASIQSLQLSLAEACRQLATVEVQFGTVETIVNKTQASNERELALLWNKSYGQEYPTIFYAVTIPHDPMPCLHP